MIDRLYFYDDQAVNEQMDTKAAVNRNAFVVEAHGVLAVNHH